MTINDVIRLEIDRTDIISAIHSAKNHQFLDNLRDRSPIVSFDSKVRGYLGEIAIKKWLIAHNIDQFRRNRINEYSCDIDLDIISNNKSISCEIKTSKIPDRNANLNSVINCCDIKIIKRNADVMVDRDMYIQIYYEKLTKDHDNFLIRTYNATGIDSNADENIIYDTYHYSEYINHAYFVAWDYKEHIESRILALPQERRTYRIGRRVFFTCKIRESNAPISLIEYIRNY